MVYIESIIRRGFFSSNKRWINLPTNKYLLGDIIMGKKILVIDDASAIRQSVGYTIEDSGD